MDRKPRAILLSAVLLVPAAALAAGCGTSDRPAVRAAEASGPTALVPCSGGQRLSARCGSVEVPLDRAHPAAGTTKVAFALVPRRDQSAPSAGTLLFNPGGPGLSGIAQAAEIAKRFAPLLDRRDLLIVDPHGTGRSGALRCRALDAGAALAALVYTNGDARLFGALPAAAARGRAGDLAPLQRLLQAGLLAKATLFESRMASLISPAQSFATQCHDYPRAFSLRDRPGARRAAYTHARAAIGRRAFRPFSPAAWTSAGFEASDTCLAWPATRSRPVPVMPSATLPDVPVLVLSGDLDANTPSSAGRRVARQFPRATFAEIPNAGHTPTDTPCGLQLGLRFVATASARANACAGTGTPPRVGSVRIR